MRPFYIPSLLYLAESFDSLLDFFGIAVNRELILRPAHHLKTMLLNSLT